MVFEHIERLKQEYTDKSVVVDNGRTDLSRFRGLVGTVITVNMSGRALVQFDGHNDIGRYDIDLDFLKVVDKPVKKTKETAPSKVDRLAEKPTTSKPSAASGKKESVADILAAARSDSANKTEPAKPRAKKPSSDAAPGMSVADIMAAARSGSANKTEPAKPRAKKPSSDAAPGMSVADIMAAARAGSASDKPKPENTTAEKTKADSPKDMSVADIMAAARAGSASDKPKPEKTTTEKTKADSPKDMTVADIMAAARAETSGTKPNSLPQSARPVFEAEVETGVEDSAPAEPDSNELKAPNSPLPTDVPSILGYCRKVDS